jgi:peptide/nickel transport system permease protein
MWPTHGSAGRNRIFAALALLAVVHGAVMLASCLAPYDPAEQDRLHPFAPPGIAGCEKAPCPVKWLARDEGGRIRLFGVDSPARIYILGTDQYGRDQFSRLLYGGRISLGAGLLAAALSLGVGWLAGASAGYCGGRTDDLIMRLAEFFVALPWLYLLFAVRAFLPLDVEPGRALLLLAGIIGLAGWARPARLVRGVVLSARERGYVLAARGFGASHLYILRRHVLPRTAGVALTQAALLVPQYVLAEVTLSFLGLGVGEPAPSWGNMLAALAQYHVLASYWWMLLPAVAIVPVFLGYLSLATAVLDNRKSLTL